MKKIRIRALLLMIVAMICIPQMAITQTIKPFNLWVDFGAGYSRNISPGVPATASSGGDFVNGGFTGLVRIRGSRSTFITLGVETGWQQLSSVNQQNAKAEGFGTTDIKATLSAIPVMALVSLQDYNLQVHGSFGIYRIISKATVFGGNISSSEWDMAFSLALDYEIVLTDDYKIVPEFRWSRIIDLQKSFLSLMIRFEMPVLELF